MIENESAGEWHPGDGWKVLEGTNFSRHIGPFYYRPAGKHVRFCMKSDSRHDNSHERAHGGVVMSFADEALGFAGRWSRDNLPMFTIEFDCRFLDAILCSDVVEVVPEVIKATRSLMFMRGDFTVDDRPVASCTGVWKVLEKR